MRKKLTRREAARTLVQTPRTGASPPGTSTPLDELVNSLEFADQAKRVLPDDVFSSIDGSDRSIFDRYTFRPRMNVPTLDMDLSVELFGQTLFTPIVVGPVSQQQRYHPDGDRATLAGAFAAKTTTIVSQSASVSLSELTTIAAEAEQPLWLAVDADKDGLPRAEAAAAAGASAIFVNISSNVVASTIDWSVVEAIRKTVDVPVVLKGVMTEVDARQAVAHGCDGLVVSNYGGLLGGTTSSPLPELRSIVELTGGELPILVDGSFRRATDVLVALILGARGVLLARPIMWALAAYGADGVTTLLRMLQRDLARCFAMLGASNLEALTPSHLKIHARSSPSG